MKDHQAIITALAKVRVEVKANCKCGGKGKVTRFYEDTTRVKHVDILRDKGGEFEYIPCPDCAEVRALDLCWHRDRITGISPKYQAYTCDNCGKQTDYRKFNPDLTTEPYKIDGEPQGKLWIVHVMQVLGVWEGFVRWHNKQSLYMVHAPWGYDYSQRDEITPLVSADILTDGSKLVPAIEAYLKEREG